MTSGLRQDGTAEPVPRDQLCRRERGQGKHHFPLLSDHEHEWQPCLVHPYSPECADHAYIQSPRYGSSPRFLQQYRHKKGGFISPEKVMWYAVLAFLGSGTTRRWVASFGWVWVRGYILTRTFVYNSIRSITIIIIYLKARVLLKSITMTAPSNTCSTL